MKPIAVLLYAVLALGATAEHPSEAAVKTVLATERAWLDAYELHDLEAMEHIVADGFVITYQDGGSQSKSDILKWIRQARTANRKGSKITTENTVARRFGDHTVVLKGEVITERVTSEGKTSTVRSLYTDTWVFLEGRWQVAASHLTVKSKS
jgi:ketosteroid isomerase-like protein